MVIFFPIFFRLQVLQAKQNNDVSMINLKSNGIRGLLALVSWVRCFFFLIEGFGGDLLVVRTLDKFWGAA